MNHHRWHIVEKIQVEAAAAIALAAMYFLIWPVVKPWDVDGAVVFLPLGAWGRLLEFAAMVWLLAGLCALLTVSARIEGALLATLVGVGGASLHSDPMRLLLMRFENNLSGLLQPLVGELACMVVVLMVAMVVIQLVRGLVSMVRPGWVRPAELSFAGTEPTGPLSAQRRADQAAQAAKSWGLLAASLLTPVAVVRGGAREFLVGLPSVTGRKAERSASEFVLSIVASFGLTLLIGLLLTVVTLWNAERGQILFSLAVSFFLAATAASYFFPAGFSTPCWLAPLVLGAAFYLKASGLAFTGPLTWSLVDAWANILPVDWLSAGCGGAVGGYWLSCRLHDLKHMPEEQK